MTAVGTAVVDTAAVGIAVVGIAVVGTAAVDIAAVGIAAVGTAAVDRPAAGTWGAVVGRAGSLDWLGLGLGRSRRQSLEELVRLGSIQCWTLVLHKPNQVVFEKAFLYLQLKICYESVANRDSPTTSFDGHRLGYR